MTAARRRRKARAIGFFLFLATSAAVATAIGPRPGVAAMTERIVTSAYSGLAIDGVDPVAYFTDAQPLIGKPEFEFRYQGVVWRFRNAGNKAAFAQSPDVYMPRYGGYDPVAVARGIAVAGNPLLWEVSGQRLYLFFSAAARAQFTANKDKIIAEAETRWPAVVSTLPH